MSGSPIRDHTPRASPADAEPGRRLALFPAERRAVVESIVADLLADRTLIIIRGEPGVGKTTLLGALGRSLAGPRFRVIRPVAGQHSARDVHRMIGEALGLGAGGALAEEPEAGSDGNDPLGVVLLDDADRCSASLLQYLPLALQLFNRGQTLLGVVLVGGVEPWAGLPPDALAPMRPFARHYLVPTFGAEDAAEYLALALADAGVARDRGPRGRAVAPLLEPAGGIPGRIDAVVAALLAPGIPRRPLPPARVRAGGWPAAVAACVALAMVMGGVVAARHGLPVGGLPVGNTPGDGIGPASRISAPAAAVVSRAPTPLRMPEPSAAGPGTDPRAGGANPTPEAAAPPPPAPLTAPPGPETAEAIRLPDPVPPAGAGATAALPRLAAAAPVPGPHRPATITPEVVTSVTRLPEAPPPVASGTAGLVLLAQRGDTMPSLFAQVYRGVTAPPYAVFEALNRTPLKPGTLIVFPPPPNGWNAP